MKAVVFSIALFTIAIGVVGVVAPDVLTAVRRQYFATPAGLYAAGALRIAMGLAVMLYATRSRAPRILRVLGAVACMQGLAAIVLGPGRAQAVLEWEAGQAVLLRGGAVVALATGVLIAVAVRPLPLSGGKG